MAFSGDKTWTVTRDDIILAALRKAGAQDAGQGTQTFELTDAALALNAIVKEWTAEGLAIWLRQRTILFLNSGQRHFQLGNPVAITSLNRTWNNACADSQLRENVLTSAVSGGATVIPCLDSTWQDADRRVAQKPSISAIAGVRLDDNTMWWDTLAAVGTADQVSLTNAIPSGRTVAAGSYIYTFTSRTARPVRCLGAWRSDHNGIENEVELIGRMEYERLSLKSSSGAPTQVCFEPIYDVGATGHVSVVHVWPCQPPTNTDKLILLTQHYSDDLDAASNNPQFPPEWANALIWNLAYELSFEYQLPLPERAMLKREAEEKKQNLVDSSDRENADVRFAPAQGW